MRNTYLFVAFVISILILNPVQGQVDLSEKVPVDPDLRHGKLDNGLTYYIRHNEEPKDRASFYIIQNVGALLENDDQNGLAHFLEHMAFNGTENFPDKGIIDFLERHGVAFGEDINAFTSQNETVYNLSDVPLNKPGIIDSSLLILHDWSNYLLLTDKEIDAERGVILEELRTRENASRRMYVASMPYMYNNSKYAERDVIGDKNVLKNFKYNTLRDFYHEWYRTDLQAIAIVGDFNADTMESKVKALFGSIPANKNPEKRPFFEIPDKDEPVFGLVTDPEADQSLIMILIRQRIKDDHVKTVKDLRDSYIESLFNQMMSTRINELLQKGDPPFVAGSIDHGQLVRGYDALSAYVIANTNEEDKALASIVTELERVRRYGFTEGELERAKSNMLNRWEKYYKERDKKSNDSYISEYADNYLENEPVPSVGEEFDLVKELLPTIELKDFNEKSNDWFTERNLVLLIQGPDKEDVSHLNQQEAFAIVGQVLEGEVSPYEDMEVPESLVSEDLPVKEIISTRELPDLGAVEWTLENHAKVVFRHAEFEKDQVLLNIYSKGGSSLFDDSYVPSADMLPDLMDFYGIGDFNAIDLQKILTGKNVSLEVDLRNLSEGFRGSASPKDMETLLQLVYLSFNHPRFDREAHQAIMARYRAFIQNMGNNPQKIMSDSLMLISYNYSPRVRVLNEAYLDEVKLDKIEEIYHDRFKDASDFDFFIVGNMDAEEVKPLVQKYIGAIGEIDRKETWIDRKIYEPDGVVKKRIPIKFETPKSNVNVIIHKEMAYTPENRLIMQVISGILDIRYVETIREEEGGTYGVSVNAGVDHYPVEKASMTIRFDCDPERAFELKDLVYKELENMAKHGPTEKDLDKVKENLLKDREQSKEHNSYYLSSIYNLYVNGINFNDPANYEMIIQDLTVKKVKKVMKQFFKDPNIVDIVFVPED